MPGKSVSPYLAVDLDRLEEMNASGRMVVGVPDGMVVVRCRTDDPDGKAASFDDAQAYLRELVRLARIGQRIEREAAANVARGRAAEPLVQ